jgi:hypothetical protein
MLYPLENAYPPEQCPKRIIGLPHAMGTLYIKQKNIMKRSEFKTHEQMQDEKGIAVRAKRKHDKDD